MKIERAINVNNHAASKPIRVALMDLVVQIDVGLYSLCVRHTSQTFVSFSATNTGGALTRIAKLQNEIDNFEATSWKHPPFK